MTTTRPIASSVWRNLVPLQSFGSPAFSSANTAAQNTAAITLALASGMPLCILPESSPFKISAPIVITGNQTLVGLNKNGCTIQPPTNTAGMQISGLNNWVAGITIQYAAQEPIANTGSVAFQFGNGSSAYLYYSKIEDLTAVYAQRSFSTSGNFGEFQNIFNNLRSLFFSEWGIYFGTTGGNSGSVFNNIRIENTHPLTQANDCTGGWYFGEYDNFVVNMLNIEALCPSNQLISFATQSSGIINGLHFEKAIPWYSGQNLIVVNNQCDVTINNLAYVNSNMFGGFNLFDVATADCRLTVNGFLDHDNTFTGTLPAMLAGTAGSKVIIDGLNGRNSGNFVIPARTSLIRVEDTIFDVAGGRLIGGLAGSAAPSSGGMPSPFKTTAGVALPWAVGDRCNNTAPTSTSTTGWRCTTAGSPGTWTAEPVL